MTMMPATAQHLVRSPTGGIFADTAGVSAKLHRFRTLTGIGTFLAAALVTACASPTAPTSPASSVVVTVPESAPSADTVTLTVRVFQRGTQTPVAGATVHLDQRTAQADAYGTCEFTMNSGGLANVEVSASGFSPLTVSGILRSNERWTFYLEQQGNAR